MSKTGIIGRIRHFTHFGLFSAGKKCYLLGRSGIFADGLLFETTS